RLLEERHWKLFAPRLGFSYRFAEKTVVRGGYGIFYLPNDVAFSTAPNGSPVNTLATPWVSTIDGSVTPVERLSNPFPNGILQPPPKTSNYQHTPFVHHLTLPLPLHPSP